MNKAEQRYGKRFLVQWFLMAKMGMRKKKKSAPHTVFNYQSCF